MPPKLAPQPKIVNFVLVVVVVVVGALSIALLWYRFSLALVSL